MTALIFLVSLAVALRAIATTGKEATLARGPYTVFWLACWSPLLILALNDVYRFFDVSSLGEWLFFGLAVYLLVTSHFLFRRVCWRLNDLEMGRALAYVALVPYLNLLVFIFLSLPKGKVELQGI
jgi:hypothetical protein